MLVSYGAVPSQKSFRPCVCLLGRHDKAPQAGSHSTRLSLSSGGWESGIKVLARAGLS